jgi:hypothetical protein
MYDQLTDLDKERADAEIMEEAVIVMRGTSLRRNDPKPSVSVLKNS